MRHVLYIMIGMPSAYHSGIEFCARLKRAGMQTTIACNLDVSSLVHEHGIDFHHLSEGAQRRESFAHDLKALNGLPQPRRLWRTLLCGRRHRVAPDVLAIDMECHYAIVATRRWKLPTVLCSRWFDSFRSAGYPPLHSQRLPSDSGLGKEHSSRSTIAASVLLTFVRLRVITVLLIVNCSKPMTG